jgi:hypothetical protein
VDPVAHQAVRLLQAAQAAVAYTEAVEAALQILEAQVHLIVEVRVVKEQFVLFGE